MEHGTNSDDLDNDVTVQQYEPLFTPAARATNIVNNYGGHHFDNTNISRDRTHQGDVIHPPTR
jgi:hypothetical protein